MKDFNLKDRKVLVRVDFDTPLDKNGDIIDDHRIKICIPTIKYILKQDPKQIILMWKLGRPQNRERRLKIDKTAKKAEELLGKKITKVRNWGKDGLPSDQIITLENMRFNPKEQGNKVNKDKFAKHLASQGDLYINDAFAMAHRKDASVYNIAKFIPGGIGFNFKREIQTIKQITENPERPFTIILGGAKGDKIDSIDNLIGKADNILIGGILANTFLKGKGYGIGESPYFHEKLAHIKKLLKNYDDKIVLPNDVKITINGSSKTYSVSDMPEKGKIMDVGKGTIEKYIKFIENSNSIYWAGPLGVFEREVFEKGTRTMADKLASTNNNVLIGGGDTSSAVNKFGLSDEMTFVSSGGGASLRLVEGKKLPALNILRETK